MVDGEAVRSPVLLLTAVCRTEALELFPFETHQILLQGSDESALLTLTTPLVIQQQNYSAVTVWLQWACCQPEEAGHGRVTYTAFQSTGLRECMGKAVLFSAQFHQGASNRIWRNSRTL